MNTPLSTRSNQLLFALLSLFTFIAASCGQPVERNGSVTAFTHVTLLPMTDDKEEILEDQTVLVQGDRIMEVGPSEQITPPEGAVVIDGRGHYLVPGLAEMHGHIPNEEEPEYAENVLFLYIANGVTTVRNMSGGPWHLELRDRVLAGELPGPVIHAASPWLGADNVPSPEAADRVVREYKEMGFDLLKLGSISRATYEQMATTAHEVEIPFAGHIPEQIGLVMALEAGQASIDHLDRYVEFLASPDGTPLSGGGFFGSALVDRVDRSRIPEAVRRTVEAGTWNVPTLSLIEHIASSESAEEMIRWPEMKYMPQNILQHWVNSKQNFDARPDFQPDATRQLIALRHELLKALHDEGAPIALGSDAPQWFNVPGFSLHREMKMMVDAGLTPYQVLATGTRNPALYFDEAGQFGIIAKGARADLILLRSNPLEEITHISDQAGVMVRGEWWPREEIQSRLDRISRWAAN